MIFPKAPKDGALVALVSGGLDSLVVASMARAAGWRLFALNIDNKPRPKIALESGARIA